MAADQPAETTEAISGSPLAPPPPTTPVVDGVLESKLAAWAAGQRGTYGIRVREVSGTQRMAAYQPDRSFVTASTYKLFLAYGILSAVEKGQLTLQTPVGTGQDVATCLDTLIIHSQNDCAWQLGRLIGWGALDDFLHQQGFRATDINNFSPEGSPIKDKRSTPTDEAELVWRLQTGTLLKPAQRDLLLARMKAQVWRERIPAGLPPGIEVAAKPGWLTGVENDAAIVYGAKSTYVLVIMSEGATRQQLADLSRLVYAHLNN